MSSSTTTTGDLLTRLICIIVSEQTEDQMQMELGRPRESRDINIGHDSAGV